MSKARTAGVVVVEMHGGLSLWLSITLPCDEHHDHRISKSIRVENTTAVKDATAFLSSALMDGMESCDTSGWQVDMSDKNPDCPEVPSYARN